MRQTIAKVLLGILIIFFCGCGGSSGSGSSQISRARIIANENLKLNKQIADKDLEIKELEKKIADLEVEKEEIVQQNGDIHIKLLEMVAESEKRNEELAAENLTLKEELEKLKQ